MSTEEISKAKFVVQTEMTEEMYRYGSRGFQKYSFRSGGWKVWAFFLVMLPLTGAGMIFAGGVAGQIYSFMFGVLLLIFIPLFFAWVSRKSKVAKTYRKIVDDMEGNIVQTYSFGEESFEVKRWYIEETIKYSFLVFILEMPDMFMLFLRNNTIYYFKKDEISGGSARELREFLEKKAEITTEFVAMKG